MSVDPNKMFVNIGPILAETPQLSTAEFGSFMLLLMFYAHHGFLPKDEKRLSNIAHCRTSEWNEMRDVLLSLFVDDEKGLRPKKSDLVRGGVLPEQGRVRGVQWQEIRTQVFERDGYTCFYCGNTSDRLECDHVVPVSKGGSSHPENLVTACVPCNRRKGAKSAEEWMQ